MINPATGYSFIPGQTTAHEIPATARQPRRWAPDRHWATLERRANLGTPMTPPRSLQTPDPADRSAGRTSRRRLLRLGAGALGAASLGAAAGCAGTGGSSRYQRPLSRQPFVAPRISPDRVVRVIVGLRPYRPAGFVVRREQFDATTVIHNYGHGGGGISLSWGSSALAVREAAGLPVGDAAVLGSGIMGLTTARLLQDAGWRVTIYSRDVLRHTTSNVGGGQWAPTSVFQEAAASAPFKAQFRQAATISHHAFQNLVGAGYGVRFIENYYLGNSPIEASYYLRELPDLFTSVADLSPRQHPFPVPYVRRTVTMIIEPATFLRRGARRLPARRRPFRGAPLHRPRSDTGPA